ncbi:MAG: ZIP family metal transporter [Thermoleophilaceae bacterium]
MAAALGWGFLCASSLLVGVVVALLRPWPARAVGLVLAFGAGALISAVSFELAAEGAKEGSTTSVAVGLGAGALVYYALDGVISERGSKGRGNRGRSQTGNPGSALALGALLDGIPEQLVLGIGLAAGGGVGVSLLVAIYVSNLPEAIGSADAMRQAGRSRGEIAGLWAAVATVCTLATVAGYALADAASGELKAGIDGFAAGALLVMLVDSMVPEAASKAGRAGGLVTALGFAVAAGLSAAS